MNGVEKFQYILVFFIILLSASMISYGVRRKIFLRKIFNFSKELRKVKIKMRKPDLNKENATLIGYNGKRPVFCADNSKHVFVCGTTGSGKTVALSNYIKNAMDKNFPLLIIDGKGDTNKNSIIDIVNRLNTKYKSVYTINLTDIEQSDKYNPFCNASPTIAKDMLINMTDWSEEHYKLNAERYLQKLIMLMHKAEIKLTLKTIVKYMSLNKFTELSAELLKSGSINKSEHLENIEICKTSGKVAENSIARFSTIVESELGYIFDDNGIDIYTALRQNAIIVFILNPLIYPEISQAFGNTFKSFIFLLIIYTLSIMCAFTPAGEKLLRFLNNIRPLETSREKEYILPLFEEVYEQAKIKNKYLYDREMIEALYLLEKISLGDNSSVIQKMIASHPRITKRIE